MHRLLGIEHRADGGDAADAGIRRQKRCEVRSSAVTGETELLRGVAFMHAAHRAAIVEQTGMEDAAVQVMGVAVIAEIDTHDPPASRQIRTAAERT